MRVGIVRLTSLGDVLHTLPVAHALRLHDPTAYVVWIVEEREQSLLLHNPIVDELVVGPTRRWRRALRTPSGARRVLREWAELRDRLHALRLDVAIDVQGLLKSALFTVLTRAPKRIGFDWRHARGPLSPLFTTHRVIPPPEAAHVVDKNLSLLGPLGIPVRDVEFPLPVVPEAEWRADTLLRGHGVKPDDRVVALLPATRRAVKQWPPAHYRGLAERLGTVPGIRVLLLGGPGEGALLDGIARDVDRGLIATADGAIPDLVALLRRAHLAIGNDTGPLHVAAALGIPAIGLYGPTRAERNGPYGPRGRAIQSPTDDMKAISIDGVFRVAMECLA